MILENKEGYRNLLLGKAEQEHWEITVDSDNDRKLYEMLIGETVKLPKQKKKMSMENLTYIIFGRNAVDTLLTKGFTSINDLVLDKNKKK